jgi:cytochrome c553
MIRRFFRNWVKPAMSIPPVDADLKQELWKAAGWFAVFAVVLAAGGLVVAVSGVVPIKASSGHWRITSWFLNFSSQRSVATHTLGMTTPRIDDPALVLKGGGAYDTNCRPCHGDPALRAPRVAQAMTPRPPFLPDVLHLWKDRELFYIVKHGIKLTGMPAWPAQQRDDEVWAMVAFLRALPGLNAESYRQLVAGPGVSTDDPAITALTGPQTVRSSVTAMCARCHGFDGLGRGQGAFPVLAGQNAEYLAASLRAYERRQRYSGVMEPVVTGLNDGEIRDLALYFSALPVRPVPQPETTAEMRLGQAIVEEGIPARRVPPCASCHGPDAAGQDVVERNPHYPKLAGQYADYLILQLQLFKNQQRGGTPYSHIMRRVAAQLDPEQIRQAAHYFASLDP